MCTMIGDAASKITAFRTLAFLCFLNTHMASQERQVAVSAKQDTRLAFPETPCGCSESVGIDASRTDMFESLEHNVCWKTTPWGFPHTYNTLAFTPG
jgi:hypothetical protein